MNNTLTPEQEILLSKAIVAYERQTVLGVIDAALSYCTALQTERDYIASCESRYAREYQAAIEALTGKDLEYFGVFDETESSLPDHGVREGAAEGRRILNENSGSDMLLTEAMDVYSIYAESGSVLEAIKTAFEFGAAVGYGVANDGVLACRKGLNNGNV